MPCFASLCRVSNCLAAAFEQHRISPNAMQPGNAFADANLSKATTLVQGDAGFVLRKDTSLKRPYSVLLRSLNQLFKQDAAKALSAPIPVNVNTDLCHSAINRTPRDGAQRRPALHPAV